MNFDLEDSLNSAVLDHDFQNDQKKPTIPSMMSNHGYSGATAKNSSAENSLVLKELFDEMDQLREKIKLNQRQLLFLESENHRLLQEKNKYFFESKNTADKLQIVVEKNDSLSQAYDTLNSKHELLEQREQALTSLLTTQGIDLQRMSKFYLKIKNVIKPYILNLKNKITELTELTSNQRTKIDDLQKSLSENLTRVANLQSDLENSKKSYQFEKIDIVKNYEEQMHDLAKEIVEVKNVESETRSENQRLKKNLENKYALENELVKYKRDVSELTEKNNQLETANAKTVHMLTSVQNELSMLKQKFVQSESLGEQKSMTVESLRSQLASKLDEVEKMSLRIKMFEKLNLSLSLSADNNRAD